VSRATISARKPRSWKNVQDGSCCRDDLRGRCASGTYRERVVLGTLVIALGVAVTPIPSAPAQTPAVTTVRAADQAPIAVDDVVTMTPWTSGEEVRVLSNDSDPDQGNLQVCRLEAPDDAGLGVHIWSDQGLFDDGPAPSGSTYLVLEPQRKLATGPLQVTYYACDRELLTPATLTVDVVHITAQKVRGRSGVVRFTNPLDYAVDVLYAAPHSQRLDGVATIRPHGTKDRRVRHSTIVWYAFPHEIEGDGDDPLPIDGGRVRHTGARDAAPRGTPTPRQERMWGARSLRPHVFASQTTSRIPAGAVGADPASDAAPVTTGDEVTFDYYDSADVRVLANDSDDSPGELAVCWVDVPADSGLYALIEPWWADSDRARSDSPDRYIDLGASAADAGTYTLTYYACDKRQMTPGTLTVTVREFPPPKVRRVPGRPGTVEFTNRGYRGVTIHYFSL